MGDVDPRGGEPQIDIDALEAVERDRLAVPVALAGGQQPHGGDVGRQIERVGGERPLQRLPAAVGQRQHALAGIAVELDVDAGQTERAAHHVGLGLERETAEATARQGLLAGPAHGLAQRRRIGRQRALHLEGRPMAQIAVEGELERGAGEADLEPGPIAPQRGGEIGEADGGVEHLVVPGEVPGAGEALRDRGPGERELDVGERLDDLAGLVAQDEGAVLDPNLRERAGALVARLERARERLDVAGPVGAAVGVEHDADGGPHQRYIGDLDAADQEREEAQRAVTTCSAVSPARRRRRRQARRRRSAPCRSGTAIPRRRRAAPDRAR